MAPERTKLQTWCDGDEWCPMVATSLLLGRKWHPVIVHRLLEHGPLAFGELESRIQGISGKVLSESLTDLEEKQLVERTVVAEKPVRVRYSLTEHGEGLADPIADLHQWGREYLAEADTPEESII
jgi:DNA-binding HxlR family transcriptional regulator